MKITKIHAVNSKGEGLLPMKKGREQEEKKSVEQQGEEVCNFVKNAFVVSGEALVSLDKPIKAKGVFLCKMEEQEFFDLKKRKSFRSSKYSFLTTRNPETGKVNYIIATTAPSGIDAYKFVKKKWYIKNKR